MTWGNLSKYRSELMGIACLWVMLHHNFFAWPESMDILRRFSNYGNLGVDVFLLLSGVGLYFAWQKKPKLSDFYARRFVRLLVPYVLFAVPYWVWRDLWLGNGNFWLDVTQLSLPLKGVITTWYIPAIAVMYLCYPLIARFLFSGDHRSRTVYLCAVLMLGCIWLQGREIYKNCEIALTRSVIFVVGCCLGKAVCDREPVADFLFPLSGLWLVLNWIFRQHVSLPAIWIRFSYVPLCLALCLVLIRTLDLLERFGRLRKFLRFFGERSLELYMTHVLIRKVFYHYIPVKAWDRWGILTYAVILLISLILSTALHPVITNLCGALLRPHRKESV